jgi:type VI secretion system protein ImpB
VPAVPGKESVNKKLERVRPPRVHVTYDVEIGDAIEVKELPFVMGVLADLSGQPVEELPRLKDRRFVEITPDNFDGALESFKPHLEFAVENKLSDDAKAGQLAVSLDFKKLEDFEPAQVAKQVEPLKQLLDLRTKLSDLRGALQGNYKLDEALMEIAGNTEKLGQAKKELEAGNSEGEKS